MRWSDLKVVDRWYGQQGYNTTTRRPSFQKDERWGLRDERCLPGPRTLRQTFIERMDGLSLRA